MDNKLKDGEKIQATPLPKQEIGIDTNGTLAGDIVSAYESSSLSASDIERFSTISQSRETVYQLIDTMGRDSSISAILETYAEDTCETNENGKIVWVESKDPDAASYCNYLLDLMNVDKNIYSWAISLIKYGDAYIRLYRESDFVDDKPKENAKKVLQENYNTSDVKNKQKSMNEDVNIIIHDKNDDYTSYVEMVDNPAEMFELTRFGKTVGYIKAPTRVFRNTSPLDTSSYFNQFYSYNFNEGDVEVYPADDFVHAKLEDTTPRAVETVSFEFNDNNKTKTKYKVVRGQSILANAFKIWRLLSLLENSVVLSRVTKSSIIRVLQLEIGDMDKQSAQRKLMEIKQNIEQKAALHENESMGEYNNPGPVENTIYLTTHGGIGGLTTQTLGGDVDPKQLTDLSYFQDKLYGAFRVPKQYFCLRGDTKLTLLNGEEVSIKEMYDNGDKYLSKGILSCKEDGTLEPTKIKDIMLTRKNASFVRVYLDNDTYVDTTPDHRFMLRDGSYKEAQYLTNEDLMSQSLQIKVIKVEKLDVIEDAYDIEVESSNHNFVLTNGIFVHNCHTEDGAGFNGGASLSIISSRYGKSIKRIQNALAQMITDILNLKLINKGFNSYVNNFTVRMKAPVTQEEIDARAAQADNVRNVQDIINTLSDVSSTSTKLEITKALLTPYINNEVITILQQEIDKVKKEEEEGVNSNDNEENEITPSRGGSREREEPNELPREEPNELPTPEEIGAGIEEPSEENETPSEEETSRPIPTLDSMNNEEEGNYGESLEDGYLPTPEELGIDATKPLEQ